MSQETIIPAQPGYFALDPYHEGVVIPIIGWRLEASPWPWARSPILLHEPPWEVDDSFLIWSDALVGFLDSHRPGSEPGFGLASYVRQWAKDWGRARAEGLSAR